MKKMVQLMETVKLCTLHFGFSMSHTFIFPEPMVGSLPQEEKKEC